MRFQAKTLPLQNKLKSQSWSLFDATHILGGWASTVRWNARNGAYRAGEELRKDTKRQQVVRVTNEVYKSDVTPSAEGQMAYYKSV